MSHLEIEIREQPAVLERLMAQEWPAVRELAREISARKVRYVMIAARGSSDNAATYGKYLLGAFCRLPVALAAPSLFTLYRRPPRMDGALVLGISQSGQSPDIVSVLEEAAAQGALTAVITNDPVSPLANSAGHVIQCHAGEERSVAATKTYTSQVLSLAMLGCELSAEDRRREELKSLPEQVEQTLMLEQLVAQAAPRYRYMDSCVVIGRGFNYATAFEIALKLKELTYVIAEPYSSADFLHGPLAIIEHGFPVLIAAPQGAVLRELKSLIEQLRDWGAELIIISDDEEALQPAHVRFRLPAAVPEWLSPLTAVIPGQLLALHLTLAKGFHPDHPRGLRKVTETY